MAAATAKKTENTFTVFRRQVIQTGEYEPAEASCSVTITVDGEMSPDAIAEQIAEWGNTLEMANYEALGVGYEMTEQGIRRLQKSVPGGNESPAVAAAPPPRPAASGGGAQDDLWRDVMNNNSKWFTNWPEQLDGSENPKRPAYRRSADGKGLWLTRKDGSANFPNFFVCPKTGKTGEALTEIGNQISQKVSS